MLSACGHTSIGKSKVGQARLKQTTLSPRETEQSNTKPASQHDIPVPQDNILFKYRPDSGDYYSTHSFPISPLVLHKRVNDYADQLAMLLMENAYGLNKTDKLAVASFVRLDSSLSQPTLLGNRLAESLITELRAFGVTVIDTKLSDSMVITERGDLVFSRDTADLAEQLNIDYIVSGTLTERPRGVEVNARIIGVKHQNVAAASYLYIPSFIVANEAGGAK
jgi:TolB-like protein